MLRRTTPQPLIYVPPVYSGEVMLAYLLRLSEENGYTNPADILRYAGLPGLEGAGIPAPEALQEVFDWSQRQLETASQQLLALKGKRGNHDLLGHALGNFYVHVWHPKVCPICIRERGYHLPEWHLAHVIACAEHRCMLITHCPHCDKALRWFRRGLLVCNCGGAFDTEPIKEADPVIVRIVDLIVRKLVGRSLVASPAEKAGYPVTHLTEMCLADLLKLIYQLGRIPSRVPKKIPNMRLMADAASQLQVADQIFRDWPRGWFAYLDSVRLTTSKYRSDSTGFAHCYRVIYQKLFHGRYRGSAIEFMHKAFVSYGLKHTDLSVDKRLLGPQWKNIIDRAWLTASQCSKLLGADPRAIRRLGAQGLIKTRQVRHGRHLRNQFCLEGAPPDIVPRNKMGERQAAAYVGIPVSVLKVLRHQGVYKADVFTSDPRGYQQGALDQLKRSLIQGLRESPTKSIDRAIEITLDDVLRYKKCHANIKAAFIVAIMDRTINPIRILDQEPANIVLELKSVNAFFGEAIIPRLGGYALQQVAEFIGGDILTIKALIKLKLLVARKKGARWIVNTDSLKEFNSRYVCTGKLAREFRGKTMLINRAAISQKLTLIGVPTYSRSAGCHFISRKNATRLIDRNVSAFLDGFQ